MNDKKNDNNYNEGPISDSQEMFEELFKGALNEEAHTPPKEKPSHVLEEKGLKVPEKYASPLSDSQEMFEELFKEGLNEEVPTPAKEKPSTASEEKNKAIRAKEKQRIASSVEREIPAATYRLPSKALSQEGGGKIQTDPFDSDGVKTQEQYFQFEVALPQQMSDQMGRFHIGQRVYVRFSHGYEPMAWQWYRSFEELFLDELGRV